MNIMQIREQVIKAYAGSYNNTPWERKVNKMTDNQVKAIYLNQKNRGKL